uniref:Uncharacterized protein n=1 Tax=Anguilla anguilla TaxID=7936 RepID=A0A0E9PCI8_ANGAN
MLRGKTDYGTRQSIQPDLSLQLNCVPTGLRMEIFHCGCHCMILKS